MDSEGRLGIYGDCPEWVVYLCKTDGSKEEKKFADIFKKGNSFEVVIVGNDGKPTQTFSASTLFNAKQCLEEMFGITFETSNPTTP